MPDTATPTEKASPGPHRLLTLYLSRRSPAALLTDAILVMIASFVASHLWNAIASAMPFDQRAQPADSIFAAVARPAALMQTLFSILFYLGWFLVIWSTARLLAASLRTE
ncbi:hypothetical protein MNBD_PLANCTO03-1085 [hydrothermal vent metagenome]|uniref:Uncharacterized protein n=1 Tax=hydrothermal vent metagenome TaxID=652676 RepID=A0A3B1DZR2_9ZZZZ